MEADGLKINVGCSTGHIECFANIDGSVSLMRIDIFIDISANGLNDRFCGDCVDFILTSDTIEHHTHLEAVRILRDF